MNNYNDQKIKSFLKKNESHIPNPPLGEWTQIKNRIKRKDESVFLPYLKFAVTPLIVIFFLAFFYNNNSQQDHTINHEKLAFFLVEAQDYMSDNEELDGGDYYLDLII